MINDLLGKLKTFFTTRSWPKKIVLILVLIVFTYTIGVVLMPKPADADLWNTLSNPDKAVAQLGGWLFLFVASLLGKLLVVVINILLWIIEYNDFVNETSVQNAWGIIRDVCNMMFVLVLLVIAFGTILRLENYKMNRLLGKMVIMIVLVNFSKMIAGFFIDISQVITMTFANAFADTAAGNFTSMLQLKEMLSLDLGAGSSLGDASYSELIGVPLLALIMIIIALVVMVAMVMVFAARIIILWILVVFSPVAYLLSVLPSFQEYSKKWWSNFGKWLTIGPVLAFLIWFAMTTLASGATQSTNILQDPESVAGTPGVIGGAAGAGQVSVTVSEAATSENLLNFILAIAMLMLSLGVASSLGGMVGNFAGKMSGKISEMGMKPIAGMAKVAGAPLKGGWELAKTGGRKLRRDVRDSKWGSRLNLAAMYKGARQRGEEVEKLSKDRAEARGRDIWDKRHRIFGGHGDVIPAEQMVEARHERSVAAEVATLQKEQKAALLQKIWNKGGKQDELTRRAILQSLAAEGHIDDALATDFFSKEARWKDEKGNEYMGFAKNKKGEFRRADKTYTQEELDEFKEFSDIEGTSQFFRASVSRGGERATGAESIEEGALRTLYDLEEHGKKAKHYEYAGEVRVDKETGKLRLATGEEKNETVLAEINKQTSRQFAGNHPHNFSKLVFDAQNNQMRVVADRYEEDVLYDKDETDEEGVLHKKGDIKHKKGDIKDNAEYRNFLKLAAYARDAEDDFVRFSASRLTDFLGEFDAEKEKFQVYDDGTFKRSLQTMYEEHPELLRALERKAGSKGYVIKDANGNEQEHDSLDDYAIEMGWKKPKVREKAEQEKTREKILNRDSIIQAAAKKEEQASDLEQEAEKIEAEVKAEEAKTPFKGMPRSRENEKKIKQAQEKRNKADSLRSQADLDRGFAEADKFEDESASSAKDVKRNIPKHDNDEITQFAQSIKNGLADLDKSIHGLDPNKFKDIFNESAGKLSDVISKMPPALQDNLKAVIDKLQTPVNNGKVTKREDQYKVLGILTQVKDTLRKRQMGRHAVKGVTMDVPKKEKTKKPDYNPGD